MKKERAQREILEYVAEHGIVDKDRVSGTKSRRAAQRRGKIRGKRERLDLHGRTQDEAERLVRATVEGCGQRGVGSLLVIHGVGIHSDPERGAVLKDLVHRMLQGELRSRIHHFASAPRRSGGMGATIVWLV